MEEVRTDEEDPLPSAPAEGSAGVTEETRPRLPSPETRKLGGIASRQAEKAQAAMSARRERLVPQAMAAELGRSARRAAMGSARTA